MSKELKKYGIICPHCDSVDHSKVLQTRSVATFKQRFRKCHDCGQNFNTRETLYIPCKRDKTPSIEAIQRVTADYFGISVEDLLCNSRLKKYSTPRHIAMYLAKNHAKKSYAMIQRAFHHKCHSTVIHACHKIHASCAVDQEIHIAVSSLLERAIFKNPQQTQQ